MLTAVAVSVVAGFAGGVVFHKYVISEAQAIKAHVTTEVEKVRADIAGALKTASSKL